MVQGAGPEGRGSQPGSVRPASCQRSKWRWPYPGS